MNWGIIGTGNIASKFAKTINQMNNESERVIAVASRSQDKAESFAKEYSINKIPISNEVRELFFKDAKNCKAYLFSYYDQKRKYEVCFEDDCYIKWSTFMNNEYLKLSNK